MAYRVAYGHWRYSADYPTLEDAYREAAEEWKRGNTAAHVQGFSAVDGIWISLHELVTESELRSRGVVL